MLVHSDAWFAKWEAKIHEPIKNTIRYHTRDAMIMIASVLAMPWGIARLIREKRFLNAYRYQTADIMGKGRTLTLDGPPGAGKTFSGGNIAYTLAQRRWRDLQTDYFTQRELLPYWSKNGETDKISAFKDLEDAYNFFKENEPYYIPCLISSIPLREHGSNRFSYVLENKMFFQQVRVPEYSVLFCDELGKDSGSDKSKTSAKEILEFWRLPRHFFDGMFVITNQDGNQNGIFVRRSTDFVDHLDGQEWVLAPARLLRKVRKQEDKLFERVAKGRIDSEKAVKRAQELYYLKRYAATIGFRRIRYQMSTPQGVTFGQGDYFIYPAIGGIEYDDRCFRNTYRCKDKKIELRGWNKLVMETNDEQSFDSLIKASEGIECAGART